MEFSLNYKTKVQYKWKKIWSCFFLFSTYLFAPPLIMVFLEQSSLAIGMLFVAVLFHILFIKFKVINYRVVALSSIIIMSALVSTFTSPDMKPIMSALALIFIYTSAIKFIKYIQGVADSDGKKALEYLYYLLVIIGILGVLAYIKIGNYAGKNYPVFPFAEPSHFALAYAPIAYCYQMINSKRLVLSLRTVLITFLLGVLYPNLTLIVVGALQFLLLPRKISVPVMIFAAIGISVYLLQMGMAGVDYFYYRIFFDYSNLNLSNLVYLQGWEAAWIALKESYGLGLGFQQNGSQSPGFFTVLISQINSGELNRLDGGFLASKLVSEAGIFGLIFVLVLIKKTLRVFLKRNKYTLPLFLLLFYSLLLSIIVELLFRGYGYFSPTLIMLVAYLSIDIHNSQKSNIRYVQ